MIDEVEAAHAAATVESPSMTANPNHMVPDLYRIRRVHRETQDTFTLELERAQGGALRFEPGQSTMLYVFGVGEVPISISGDPARHDVLVHTIRAVGAITQALTSRKRGDLIGVRGPYGNTWPLDRATNHDVLIIPGGIGLAPLRPTIYRLIAERHRYGNVSLLYGARTPGDLLFHRELERWRGRLDLEVSVTVDRPDGDWRGNVGVVTTLIPRARFDPARTVAMVCGPEVMMRFVALELQSQGVPPSQIYMSMERNMKCFIGFCGHCQFGPTMICRDGPIYSFDQLEALLTMREV